MEPQSIIRDIEERAKSRRVTIPALCQRARLSLSTFNRWKNGETTPNLRSIKRLEAVLAEIDAEDRARLSKKRGVAA